MSQLIKKEFNGSPEKIIDKIKEKASEFNFIVRQVFDMFKEFKNHGVKVDKTFVYYSSDSRAWYVDKT